MEHGNGKSETVKQIAKELDIPYVIEDATTYTQEGYVGDSVTKAIMDLIKAANGDIKKAERGIVVFDEIDKKTDNGDSSKVSTTSVQDSLLKILEGTTIITKDGKFNTQFVTFILIGACEEVYIQRDKRLGRDKKIGFYSNSGNSDKDKCKKFIPDDFIKGGFKSEFIGRMDILQEFNPMSIEMGEQIIEKSKISVFNAHVDELSSVGVEVIFNDRKNIIREIASKAVKGKTGAREIRRIVVDMFSKIYSEVYLMERNPNDLYYCYITSEILDDNTKYTLCKKEHGVLL